MTAILWFRRDLRLADHPALCAAAREGAVLPMYVRDTALGPAQERRTESSLAALREATDGALVVRSGDPAETLGDLAAQTGARRVHVTADLTPNGRRRDIEVAAQLAIRGLELVRCGTPYAVPPGSVLTGARTPYRVFTPFARAWRAHGAPPPMPVPAVRWSRCLPGEAIEAGAAPFPLERWHKFLDTDLARYHKSRDRPDLDSTSRTSAALALGEMHPRTLLADLAAHPDGWGEGAQRFRDELCWREFCADVLWHSPTAEWNDLRQAGVEHDPDGPDVEAWRLGRTGFPLVDAGMRQLLAEGWMHNRVRMVAASFLVKDLHAPWQLGARHFLDHLIDADLASNNLNWQWVAGTGSDAAPYVRVFNPVRQGLRFDPDGAYVRRWVPELAALPDAAAHEPWNWPQVTGYPERIVDHDEERRVALARYDRARR